MIKRTILIALGFLFLFLGLIGIVLPILPTTPFVLCAAGCFGSSSPALLQRLENSRYFGEYIQNYRNKTGISRKARWTGIAFLWTTLSISAFITDSTHVRCILAVVAVCVTIHLLTIGKKRRDNPAVLPENGTVPPTQSDN